VQAGALISYGADVLDIYRRSAGLVEKSFNDAKPRRPAPLCCLCHECKEGASELGDLLFQQILGRVD
jgi:hypothetical protein